MKEGEVNEVSRIKRDERRLLLCLSLCLLLPHLLLQFKDSSVEDPPDHFEVVVLVSEVAGEERGGERTGEGEGREKEENGEEKGEKPMRVVK